MSKVTSIFEKFGHGGSRDSLATAPPQFAAGEIHNGICLSKEIQATNRHRTTTTTQCLDLQSEHILAKMTYKLWILI